MCEAAPKFSTRPCRDVRSYANTKTYILANNKDNRIYILPENIYPARRYNEWTADKLRSGRPKVEKYLLTDEAFLVFSGF